MALELVDDLRYSILELNAHAMQRSQIGQLVEAQQLLENAYIRLQSADAAVLAADAGLIDQLKATTLSNLGVVECHKKELDKSLDHLEAALSIEKRIGIFSPTTALNLCATFNALGRYEEAVDICTGAINTLMSTNGGVPTEENKSLWAAAWHNLSVAEMNLGGDIGGSDERRIAVLNMFRNAMRASVDLLGPRHPLTATIHESYRAARPQLKRQGAYKLRDGFLPLLSSSSKAETLEKRRQLNTQMLTEDEKLGSVPAYEGALAGNTGRTRAEAHNSKGVPSLLTAVRRAQRGENFRPTQTLIRAQPLYLSHHPATSAAPRQSELLLQPRQRELRQQMRRMPSIAPSQQQQQSRTARRASPPKKRTSSPLRTGGGSVTARNNSRTSPQRQGSGGSPNRGGRFNPATNKVLSSLTGGGGSGGAGDAVSWSSTQPGKRSAAEALIGDMWVEVEVPFARRNSPPQSRGGPSSGGAPALRQGPGGSSPGGEFRAPSYGQTMHVIEPSDPIMERVAQPSAFASIDMPFYTPYGAPAAPPPPQQQQQQQHSSVPVPHPMAASSMQQQQQQQQHHAVQNTSSLGVTVPPVPNNSFAAAGIAMPAGFANALPIVEAGGGGGGASAMSLAQQPHAFAAPQPLGLPSAEAPPTQVKHHQPAPPPPQQQQQQEQSTTAPATTPPPPHQTPPSPASSSSAFVASPPIPQPPKRPPSSGSRPSPVPPPAAAAQKPSSRPITPKDAESPATPPTGGSAGFAFLADALGNDIQSYPGLAMLSQM